MLAVRVMKESEISPNAYPRSFGKYQLLGPLAQGGMGALYLAVAGLKDLERLFVVKTVLPHLADKEYVARFKDEAKVVVKLSHGNLVPVFDAGEVGGELFLAMDFVDGRDLRAVWNRCAQRGIAFPVEVAAYLVKELCQGLAYAHGYEGLSLVHRDISPPNILLSYSGEVKLTDFGLAFSTLKVEKTAPGIIYGKVAYMSPEQARGESLDGRSDLYAAAIVLWELLTGRQLFPPGKEAPEELIRRTKNPDVFPPSRRAPRVPRGLDKICMRALAPNRDDRYRDADHFREALSVWLAKEAPSTGAPTVTAFLRRLFKDEKESSKRERDDLINRARKKIKTMPRSVREDTGEKSIGRRALDRGKRPQDRRGRSRRTSDQTRPGIVVPVPQAGPDGRTVVPQSDGTALAANVAPETAGESAIGQVLDKRYRLIDLLGEGGMGTVYLAEHTEIGKLVAVKILHLVYSRLPDLVERFRREARAASRIGHPHIVDVTDSGTTKDGAAYFVMEYLDGVELGSVIEREGSLDIRRALRIGSQICRALAAAHDVSIIHRDLKPENVFLTVRDGQADFVKVLDFGIAKSAEAEEAREKRLTHPGMAMGTPEYMAPEQAAGKPADSRSDIYSVGAILYEMLGGVAPYRGQNFMEILSKKANEEPKPLSEMREGLDPELEALVMGAMSRNPEGRPSSMMALDFAINCRVLGRGAAAAGLLGLRADADDIAALNPGQTVASEAWEVGSGFYPPRTRAQSSWQAIGETTDTNVLPAAPRRSPWLKWLAIGAGAMLLLTIGIWALSPKSAPLATNDSSAVVLADEKTNVADDSERIDSVQPTTEDPSVGDGSSKEELEPIDKGERTDDTLPDPDPKSAEAPLVVDVKSDEIKKPSKPNGTRGPRNRAQAIKMLRRANAFKSRLRWREAKNLYQIVANSQFKSRDGYLGLAMIAFETKQTKQVIEYASKAGRSVKARMLLGHAHYKRGEYAKALSFYEKVLAVKPNNKEAARSRDAAKARLPSR